jgi:hypothetical protein
MTKPLIPIGGSNQDYKLTYNLSLNHKPRLQVLGYILSPSSSSPSPSQPFQALCFPLCSWSLNEFKLAGLATTFAPPSILCF